MLTQPPILINARCFSRPVTGVERYAREISARLQDVEGMAQPPRFLRGPAGQLWEQAILPLQARGTVLWSPANTGPLAISQQAVSIHDLGPLDHPEWYAASFARWYAWLWPRLLKKAGRVLTDSEFSRRRLLQRFDLPPEKIAVVPVGVDGQVFRPQPEEARAAVRQAFSLEGPFVLFTGSLQPRKNLAGLASAWSRLRGLHPEWTLAIAGDTGKQFGEAQLQPGPGLQLLGRVPDAQLPGLYAAASVFVQSSFYEGGGLTVLEAMSCGTAVAAAGNTALPEYTGEAALLFDPHDPAGMRDALDRLISGRELRQQLARRGIERAQEFSWARAAAGVQGVLDTIRLPASP